MFIYNITTKVEPDIINEWTRWQKEEHIPEIIATHLFKGYKFYQLLEQDDSDGSTFVIQFFIETEENYNEYIRVFAPSLRETAIKKWGNRLVTYRSLMKVV
ncbi:MAG: DUF4286 family protein [Ginsengibacter sp.]